VAAEAEAEVVVAEAAAVVAAEAEVVVVEAAAHRRSCRSPGGR
jgi:hypothetical protein